MKSIIIALSALTLTSCAWTYTVKDIKTNTILDSLPKEQRTKLKIGEVVQRVYEDTIPAASCPGMIYKFTLYNVKSATNGVYEMNLTYIEAENGSDYQVKGSGRWSSIKGISSDSTATVYRFIDFREHTDTLNFLYNTNSLSLLNQDMEPINSTLNYTLPLVK